jgi:hypothetical protein
MRKCHKDFTRIHCYFTCAEEDILELMWKHIQYYQGWISAYPGGLLVYIPERYASIILILDSEARRMSKYDYVD